MTENIVIIDYGSGNLRSVEKSFQRAAQHLGGAFSVCVSDDAGAIADADRLILPGVGAFGACMDGLKQRPGVLDALRDAVINRAQPFLGICVGMQLLATKGYELGEHPGLDWIDGSVGIIAPDIETLRRPHMGWNDIKIHLTHPVFSGLDGAAFYFANSFCFTPSDANAIVATTGYGQDFASCVARDNIVGVQFHPEKSQDAGATLIENFLNWQPG